MLAGSAAEITAWDAFRLHDTYGFPIELTVEIAAEHGKTVDEAGFTELMDEQRDRARAAVGTRVDTSELRTDFTSEFVGFERLDVTTQVGAAHDRGDGSALVKLRESPFYARGGGQVADRGWIETDSARAVVEDVVRVDSDQVVVARLEHGELHAGERVRAHVDPEARRPTMANHTATHLLQAALREVLGEHVAQAGSYVGPDKLRFDFRHDRPMTADEIARVEQIVNDHIVANHPLHIFVTTQDHARELGATMLFGEKYGEHVRVVEVPAVSRELCGGTHVRSTAEIGAFVITRETSSSQGVRRIEALTSAAALEHLRDEAAEAAELRRRVGELESELKRAGKAAPAPVSTQRRRHGTHRRRLRGVGRLDRRRRGRGGRRRRAPAALRPRARQALTGRRRAGRKRRRQGAPAGQLRFRRAGTRPLGRRHHPRGGADRLGRGRRESGACARRRLGRVPARRGGEGRGRPDSRPIAGNFAVKVLAVDYGRARTGIAVSDETGVLARPVTVVERVRSEAGMGRMLERITELDPDRIVVGMPLTLRGEHGRQAAETLDFIHELEARCPIPIETYDERFTTAMATRDRSGPRRGDDAVAAAHLLEGYLRRLAG